MAAPVAAAANAATRAAVATPRASFGEVLQRHLSPPRPPGAGAFAGDALRGIERARVALDRALAEARAGRAFSAPELLALQADAYRFSHAVGVVTKVAEAGAQSVRQAVNTQL